MYETLKNINNVNTFQENYNIVKWTPGKCNDNIQYRDKPGKLLNNNVNLMIIF